jgi:hypothetical protein
MNHIYQACLASFMTIGNQNSLDTRQALSDLYGGHATETLHLVQSEEHKGSDD